MRLFAIDNDNAITAFPAAESVPEGQTQFASEKELASATAQWPMDRLALIWNSFAGVAGPFAALKPVKKFTDRKTAVKRIWDAIQKLDGAAPKPTNTTAETAPTTPTGAKGTPKKTKAAKAAKAARAKAGAPTAREGSKKAIVLSMIVKGATVSELMAATGWQKHSVRGFLSVVAKKQGITIESTRDKDGVRHYKIAK